MRGIERLLMGMIWACILLACATVASAQLPTMGYAFAEVIDETKKPLVGAAAVVYNESGAEVGGSITDGSGRARLVQNVDGKRSYVIRVIKSGYQTYESVFEPSGHYNNTEIKIKLVALSRLKPKPGKARTKSRPPRKAMRREFVPLSTSGEGLGERSRGRPTPPPLRLRGAE
ncbi:MAG: hypothetical protein JWM21_3915 [Acidobacteria bacterium]|nr:hypothetical protein [Acidobacteriota bacterium]